jgi:hypothetical protein
VLFAHEPSYLPYLIDFTNNSSLSVFFSFEITSAFFFTSIVPFFGFNPREEQINKAVTLIKGDVLRS